MNSVCRGKSSLGSCAELCALKLSALLFAARCAEKLSEIWPFLVIVLLVSVWIRDHFCCILLWLTVPRPQCCLYKPSPPKIPPAAQPSLKSAAKSQVGTGRSPGMGQGLDVEAQVQPGLCWNPRTGGHSRLGLRWALGATCKQRCNIYPEYLLLGIHEPRLAPGALLHTHRYFPLMFL